MNGIINLMSNQVKSKERVADFGEVNTSEREVNAMLDLVKQETERLDSRFLEPACGDGNFLIEVLNRKLDILVKKYKKNISEKEHPIFDKLIGYAIKYYNDIIKLNKKYKIISNDFMTYSFIYQQVFIKNNKIPKFEILINKEKKISIQN